MTKRQKGLLIAGAVLMVLAGLIQVISAGVALHTNWTGWGRDIYDGNMMPFIWDIKGLIFGGVFILLAFIAGAAGAIAFKWKQVQGIAFILAALASLITAIIWTGFNFAYVLFLCFVLLAVAAFLREQPVISKLALLFGYMPMLAAAVVVFNTLSSAFDGYTSASSLFWLCGDVFSTLGVMVAGAGFANAQGGKITKIAAWIGVAGIPLGLLALLMYGVAPSLGEGAVLYYIVLVVFAVLQVLALALLPLCVVYPLFGKKKPAGPAAE